MRALRYYPRAPAYRLHTPVGGCPHNTAFIFAEPFNGVSDMPYHGLSATGHDYNTATARAAVKTKTRPTRKFWILSAAKKNCEGAERCVCVSRVNPRRLSNCRPKAERTRQAGNSGLSCRSQNRQS